MDKTVDGRHHPFRKGGHPELKVAGLLIVLILVAGCLDSEDHEPWSSQERTALEYEGDWPEVSEAEIRPGVRLHIGDGACTSNFLFRTPGNETLYLGTAAHCFGDPNDATDEAVEVPDVGRIGRVAFNAFEHGGTTAPDFGLIELLNTDSVRGVTHPAMKHFGGPTKLADSSQVLTGDEIMGYGGSPQRAPNDPENPREGWVVHPDEPGNDQGDRLTIYTVQPGIQGDSGMGFMDKEGGALCVLVTALNSPLWQVLEQRDTPNVNWCETLDNALAYAASKEPSLEDLELVKWTWSMNEN